MLRKKGELRTTYKFSAWETDEPLIRATEGSACFRGKNNVVCNKFNVGFPGGLAVKNLPLMPETQELWVQSWGWGNPLEEDMATYSSILAGKIPWTEEPGRIQSTGSQRVGHD